MQMPSPSKRAARVSDENVRPREVQAWLMFKRQLCTVQGAALWWEVERSGGGGGALYFHLVTTCAAVKQGRPCVSARRVELEICYKMMNCEKKKRKMWR